MHGLGSLTFFELHRPLNMSCWKNMGKVLDCHIVFVCSNPLPFIVIGNLNTTTTATTSPQNNRFDEQKQSLCMCVLTFVTFLCLLCKTTDNVTWKNSRICGEREHTTLKFSFSFLLNATVLAVWFLGSSPFLQKLNELKTSRSSRNELKWRFRWRCRRRCLSSLLFD